MSYKPPQSVINAAKRAKKEMEKYEGKKDKPMTSVGSARMGDLAAGNSLSLDTIKRMKSFLSRHAKNYKPGERDSKGRLSKGTVAYLGWGGKSALPWVNSIIEKSKKKQ